jgi:hypothetical protein
MIKEKRLRLIGLFVLSDCLAILFSYFYSYLFRFYAYIIPVDPARGIPPLRSYIVVFPLFLAVHLGIFYLQGFYRTRLRRARIDDFIYASINGVLTILVVFSVLNYLYNYSQGQAPIYRMTFSSPTGSGRLFRDGHLRQYHLPEPGLFLLKRRFARTEPVQRPHRRRRRHGQDRRPEARGFRDIVQVLGSLDDDVPKDGDRRQRRVKVIEQAR